MKSCIIKEYRKLSGGCAVKLFTKIFLQVACVILLLSSGIFFYTTYRWKNQSIQDINNYEETKFQTQVSQFGNKMMQMVNQLNDEEEGVREKMLIYVFRQVFRDTAVLYKDGEELYNGTVYEFEAGEIKRQRNANKRDSYSISESDYQPLTAKINGKTLLLYSHSDSESENTWKINYQIITYKDITDVQKRNQLLFLQAGGLTLAFLLLAGTLLFFSLRKIMKPLTVLKDAAVSVAEGDYERKVLAEGNTELAQVGRSFNRMTDKIKEQVEHLSSVNQAQRQLLGSLAHELKTPMTAIIGYADTLLTVRLSPERQEKALIYIGNECRRLSRLSVKMLELTGLYETGEESFTPAEMSVFSFLNEVKQLTAYSMKEKNISLELNCEPTDLKKIFDKDLMLSAVTNFIDNGVKASEEGSRIILKATDDSLMIRDFGKGIPKEDLEKVTEAFYMVDKSRSRAKGSVGLGLSLCQKIVDIHGYRLEIKSALGEGTTILVWW